MDTAWDPERFAAKIKKLRADRKMTQRALAEATGLTSRTIRNLEGGSTTNPPVGTLYLLAEPLGVSVPDLLT